MRTSNLILFAVLLGCNGAEPTPEPGTDSGAVPDATADMTEAPDDLGGRLDMTAAVDLGGLDAAADMSPVDATMVDAAPDLGDDSGVDMPSCTDGYEPNNVVADATPVTAPIVISATNCGFDDDDVYAIDLTAGQTITLTHSFMNGRGNLDMNLHAPSQAGDVSKNGSAVEITFAFDDVETIVHTAEETGTYYVLSFNNNDSENDYTLEFEVQ